MTIVVSATELKNRVSEVLNEVTFKGNITVIERYGKPIAKIIPVGQKPKESIAEIINRYYGAMPDFPDVTKLRYSGRRKIPPLF